MQYLGLGVYHLIWQAILSRGKSISFASVYARYTLIYLSIYLSIYILIPPKFNFRPKGTYRPKGSVQEEQVRLLLGLLPDLEMNAYLYIQETRKVQLYIGPVYIPLKPLLGYIASLYAYILYIYKPLISSTNYRLIYAYARRILIREKQCVGPSTPLTGLKHRVSILPIYTQHTLTICIARPDPAR